MILKKIVFVICGLVCWLFLKDAYSFSNKDPHKKDYTQIFSYIDIYIDPNNPIAEKIQEMIDKVPKEIEQIAGKKFPGWNHRKWGHWGLGRKIPRETIKEICGGEYNPRSECYKQVREIWKKQVNDLIELIKSKLNIPKKEAKLIAVIAYDTHLLADYYISSKGQASYKFLKKLEEAEQIKRIDAIVNDMVDALEKLGKKDEAQRLRKMFKELKKKNLSSIDIASNLYVFIMKEGAFAPLSRGILGRLNLFKLIVLSYESNPDHFLKLLEMSLKISGKRIPDGYMAYLKKLVKKNDISKIINELFHLGIISRKDVFICYLAYNDKEKASELLESLLEESELKNIKDISKEIKELIEKGKYTEALKQLTKYKNLTGISTRDVIYFKLIKSGVKYYSFTKNVLRFGSVGITYGILSNVSCLVSNVDRKCITNIAKDTALSSISYYITRAILVKLKNGKFGIIAKAISKGGGSAPIAMFIVDNGKILYSFAKGYISEEILKRELLKNSVTMIYGYAVLAFLPGSTPVIVAVVASEFAVAYVLDRIYPDVYDKSLVYMNIEEMKKFFGLENIEHLTAFNLFEYENAFKQHYYTNSFKQEKFENPWNQKDYLSPF